MIPTPHISAKKGEIAETVLIFGDPIRCKRCAEKYLTNPREVSFVRGAYYFTGEYKGKTVTFGTSGMGLGSMGIYSYELFKFYDVKNLIRIGTSGAYSELKIGDKVLVAESVPDAPYFSKANCGESWPTLAPTAELKEKLKRSGEQLGVKLHECRTHSTDVFYFHGTVEDAVKKTNTTCVEMESYALFAQARRTGKQAACLLAITDTLYIETRISPDERVVACDSIIEVALNIL